MRADGRTPDSLRTITVQTDFLSSEVPHALIRWGLTSVLCTASVEERVPHFLRNTGRGWLTAEYNMLPAATAPRKGREGRNGRISGRTQEIQRLIGRSLRQAVDLEKLGERQIVIDCEVLEADGGTRTASVTGGWIALRMALNKLVASGAIPAEALGPQVCAVSVGICDGEALLDLDYPEDSSAQVDANFVLAGEDGIVEIQGTGEKSPFAKAQFDAMYELAHGARGRLFAIQNEALKVVK